jgi:transposase
MAVVTRSGRLTKREQCGTTILQLTALIESVPKPRWLCFEEGPLADWLFRNLRGLVEGVTVCDPRRNHLIAKESDKDDPIDAEKLARLFRGGYLKPVHHPESAERSIFKQHVALYHNRVRERVRAANRVIAQVRRHGVVIQESDFDTMPQRAKLLGLLPQEQLLQADLQMLWEWYDLLVGQEASIRKRLIERAGQESPMIARFRALPGIDWIRAATFYAYVDTPWRFRKKSALWKYLGIGLERRHSGKGPMQVHVVQSCNRALKAMILGAAQSAIDQANNRFFDQYVQWTEGGLSSRNARRNVARSMAATLWGIWKNGSAYRPELVRPERHAEVRSLPARCGLERAAKAGSR